MRHTKVVHNLPSTRTFEYCKQLAGGSTRGYSDDQLSQIAARMIETNECVWHVATILFHPGKPCWCAKCNGLPANREKDGIVLVGKNAVDVFCQLLEQAHQ